MVELRRGFVCEGIELDCILPELSLLNKMKWPEEREQERKLETYASRKRQMEIFLVVF